MGRKSRDRKTPPPQAPAAGWRLLPPTVAAADPAADEDALTGIVAVLEQVRDDFVKAHGREPTEAEVVELVSLGLADGLDEERIDHLLRDEEVTTLDPFPLDTDEDEPAP